MVYNALSSAAYSDDATATNVAEIVGAGAARVAVSNNTTNWPTTTASTKVNGTTITFPAALNTWPTALSFYILDAANGGNILFGADLLTPRTLEPGDTASFGPGAITLTED